MALVLFNKLWEYLKAKKKDKVVSIIKMIIFVNEIVVRVGWVKWKWWDEIIGEIYAKASSIKATTI